MKILVADDHDLIRDAIAAFLTNEGEASVSTAGSLSEAVDAVEKEGSFDLVLLDYNMPGMNGLDGLQEMIAANNGHPVALLSGTTTRALAEEAIEKGAAGFVPKTLAAKSMISAARFMAAPAFRAPGRSRLPTASVRVVDSARWAAFPSQRQQGGIKGWN